MLRACFCPFMLRACCCMHPPFMLRAFFCMHTCHLLRRRIRVCSRTQAHEKVTCARAFSSRMDTTGYFSIGQVNKTCRGWTPTPPFQFTVNSATHLVRLIGTSRTDGHHCQLTLVFNRKLCAAHMPQTMYTRIYPQAACPEKCTHQRSSCRDWNRLSKKWRCA